MKSLLDDKLFCLDILIGIVLKFWFQSQTNGKSKLCKIQDAMRL